MNTKPRLAAVLALLPFPLWAGEIETSAGAMRVTPVVVGLEEPWGIDFLPDGSVLVTERDGRLLRIMDGVAQEIGGTPPVFADGQGGLLDVMVPRDFATTGEVWLSFAAPAGDGAGTD